MVFAWSYVFTQFGRFAWNPNSIPFWGLLLLTSVVKTSLEKNRKKAGWWLVLAGFSFGVVSQLHFVAFLGYPIAILVFWAFSHPVGVKMRYWFFSVLTFLLVNLPIILYELKGGENLRNFFSTLSEKSVVEKGYLEILFKMNEYLQLYLALFVTSLNHKEIPFLVEIGMTCFVVAVVIGLLLWRNKKGKPCEMISSQQKMFLKLVIALLAGFLPVYLVLAHEINNIRYWFPIFIIPFVGLGLILKVLFCLGAKFHKAFSWFAIGVVLMLLVLNFSAIWKWYASLDQQREVDVGFRKWTSKTFKQEDLETAQNQKRIAHSIVQDAERRKNGICLKSPSVFTTVYKYFILSSGYDGYFKKKGVDTEKKYVTHKNICKLYLIDKTTKSEKRLLEQLEGNFTLQKIDSTGTFSVWIASLDE
jgi:hypothetical protein